MNLCPVCIYEKKSRELAAAPSHHAGRNQYALYQNFGQGTMSRFFFFLLSLQSW